MDPALLANFPRLFPKAPTISTLENARSEYIIRGNRGRTITECESSDSVMLCDDQYLASLVDEMKNIELKVELWRLKCKKPRRHFASKYNPSNFLREALTNLADVTSHVQRLRENPVLFGDSRVRQHFFILASAILDAIAQVLKSTKRFNEAAARVKVQAPKGKPSPHIMHESGIRVPPWASFAFAAHEIQDPKAQTVVDQEPALRHLQTQLLPAQGVLIHEHWRQQVNKFAEEIASASEDPQRILKQRVGQWGDLKGRVRYTANPKVVVVRVHTPVGACYDTRKGETNDRYALGEQEPVETGRASRLIAKLFGEYTSIGQPASVVRSVFIRKPESTN